MSGLVFRRLLQRGIHASRRVAAAPAPPSRPRLFSTGHVPQGHQAAATSGPGKSPLQRAVDRVLGLDYKYNAGLIAFCLAVTGYNKVDQYRSEETT